MEKKWDVKLLLRFSETTPYEPAEMITKPIVLDRIKKTSGEGATPISYMMLDGHGDENGIYDDKLNTMLFSTTVDPHWFQKGNNFWYEYKTRGVGFQETPLCDSLRVRQRD